jgi:ABC-type Co2+ transport system permease subunit
MPAPHFAPLFAVHISDGVLDTTWLAGGFVVAGFFALLAAWRIRDEEIPRIALLTAAFFVASSIHIRVGPSSWHLLFNGLVGVMLGRRAGLAIPIGLGLQYFLLMHGGFYTLGINTCIMLLPAFMAYGLFASLRSAPWLGRLWFQALVIGGATFLWTLSAVFSVALLVTNRLRTIRMPDLDEAAAITFHPLIMAAAIAIACLAVWSARRVQAGPEFALGLIVGEVSVLATIILACLVLLFGGETDWSLPVRVLLVLHLPVAALEGVVVGFLVGFLARVKPALLGWRAATFQHDKQDGRRSHALPECATAAIYQVGSAVAPSDNDEHGPGSSVAGEVLHPPREQSADRELLQHERSSG